MVYSVRNLATPLIIKIIPLVFALIFSGCSAKKSEISLPYYEGSDLTPVWSQSRDFNKFKLRHLGPFRLLNQDQQEINQWDLKGKIIVANFFFATCPSVCPITMSHMKKIRENTQGDPQILLISHTVNPEQDTPKVLRTFANDRNLPTDRWHLLTGEKKALYNLARSSYFADRDLGQDKSEEDFLHTENFYLLDPKGYIRGIYNGTQMSEIRKLLSDIQRLKSENGFFVLR